MSRAMLAVLPFLLGCTDLPPPLGPADEGSPEYPSRIQGILEGIDRLQEKGFLAEAIIETEKALVDHPDAVLLKVRLAELRSQRQVVFAEDWSEAEASAGAGSFNTAVVVLRRIERYGDPDMVRRAHERIAQIRAAHPGL